MELWLVWLIIAAAFIIVELLTQWVSTFCLAIGSCCALVACLFDASLAWQLGWLGIGTLAGFIIFMPYLKRRIEKRRHTDGPAVATGMDALIGRTAVVVKPIDPHQPGRVKVDGDSWQAVASTPINAGERVTITGYDSIILNVTKAN